MIKYSILVGIVLASLEIVQPRTNVAAALLANAARSPIEFAVLLAEASVPAGIEIKESDDSYSKPVPYSDPEPGKTIRVGDLVAAFNAAHRDYHSMSMNGVLVIRPIDGSAAALDQQSEIGPAVTITGRMEAARRIFGIRGAVLNSIGREGEDAPIVVDGTGGRKLIDTLNQIVTQSPSAWQVTTAKQGNLWRVSAFGFVRKDGSRSMQRILATLSHG